MADRQLGGANIPWAAYETIQLSDSTIMYWTRDTTEAKSQITLRYTKLSDYQLLYLGEPPFSRLLTNLEL